MEVDAAGVEVDAGLASLAMAVVPPLLLEPPDMGTVHGNDERLSVAALSLGLRILFEVVRRVCA